MEALRQYRANSSSDSAAVMGLTERVDSYRVDVCRNLDGERWSDMGHFFTPPSVARFMASLFGDSQQEVRMLNAGAKEVYLTPGSHSRLVKAIIDEFAPRFVPGGHAIYVGDTRDKS